MNLKRAILLIKFGGIRWLFPILQKYAPFLANHWATRLFISPPCLTETDEERQWRENAKCSKIEFNGKTAIVYSWGEGPPVLMIHGWAGKATNFLHFIEAFTSAGYKVIAFDAPAHGEAPGRKTNLLEFMEVGELIAQKYGKLAGCIGHSLGGIAAYFLVNKGMQTNWLITLGCPSRYDDIFRTFFTRRLKGDMSSVEFLKKWILNHYDFDFDAVFPLHSHPLKNPKALLIIHDKGDMESFVEEAQLLHEGNPGSQLMITEGLGHIKTLKDPEVIQKCLNFVKKQR